MSVTIAVQAIFELIAPGMTLDDREEHVGAVMEDLLKLEESGNGTSDAAVSYDSDQNIVEIELSATGEDWDVADACARSTIRAAIHAAGGATPTWATGEGLIPRSVNAELVSA